MSVRSSSEIESMRALKIERHTAYRARPYSSTGALLDEGHLRCHSASQAVADRSPGVSAAAPGGASCESVGLTSCRASSRARRNRTADLLTWCVLRRIGPVKGRECRPLGLTSLDP